MCLSQIMIKLTSVVAFITVKSLNLFFILVGPKLIGRKNPKI